MWLKTDGGEGVHIPGAGESAVWEERGGVGPTPGADEDRVRGRRYGEGHPWCR